MFFHWQRVSNFIECFSVSTEMIMWFLPFIPIMWHVTSIVFHRLNQPCLPGINLIWLTPFYKEKNEVPWMLMKYTKYHRKLLAEPQRNSASPACGLWAGPCGAGQRDAGEARDQSWWRTTSPSSNTYVVLHILEVVFINTTFILHISFGGNRYLLTSQVSKLRFGEIQLLKHLRKWE